MGAPTATIKYWGAVFRPRLWREWQNSGMALLDRTQVEKETEPAGYAHTRAKNVAPAKIPRWKKQAVGKKRGGGPGRPASSCPLSGKSG
jgi:hypothetical protein